MSKYVDMEWESIWYKGPLDRAAWRWLSPADEAWTWQDGRPWTQLRELIRSSAQRMVREWREASRSRESLGFKIEMLRRTAKPPEVQVVLASLEAARWVKEAADDEILKLVLEARARGVTWEEIGMSLGVSRQAAQTTLNRRLEDRRHLLLGRMQYEVEAARRVAYDVSQRPDASDRARDRADAFLELADDDVAKANRRRGKTGRRYI